MLANTFTNVRAVKRCLNQPKEIAVFIALTEQYLAHQYKKIKAVAKNQPITSPPFSPLPGPSVITWLAAAIKVLLCSIKSTVSPPSTKDSKTVISFRIS
jgi:hypothetical protein